MKVTIKDIAKEADVAYSTVSRIINGTGHFSQETIDKVEKIIKESGYVKNKNASDLVVNRNSNVIGLVMPLYHTNFTDNVISGIHEQLITKHYELLITYAESYDEKSQYKAVTTLIERGVSGIVILSMSPYENIKDLLNTQKVNFIVLGMHIDDPKIASFDFNEYKVGYDATAYLLKHGHKRIGFIGLELSEHNITSTRRLQGYIDALNRYGIKYDKKLVLPGNFSFNDGLSAKKTLNALNPPTAYIGASDLVSVGILRIITSEGFSVPNDFSLISIDGTELTKYITPSLTAVKLPFHELGNTGIKQLINKINNKGSLITSEMDISIIVRESVKKIK